MRLFELYQWEWTVNKQKQEYQDWVVEYTHMETTGRVGIKSLQVQIQYSSVKSIFTISFLALNYQSIMLGVHKLIYIYICLIF